MIDKRNKKVNDTLFKPNTNDLQRKIVDQNLHWHDKYIRCHLSGFYYQKYSSKI